MQDFGEIQRLLPLSDNTATDFGEPVCRQVESHVYKSFGAPIYPQIGLHGIP